MRKYHQDKDTKPLEDILKLMEKNFNLSDELDRKYSSMKLQLNGRNLFLGEMTKYRKEIKEIKNEMSDVLKKTWSDLIKYGESIPSETFIMYREKYKKIKKFYF
tara:strand:- start:3209 stop:3520 length:312 start_codon:yes stop_codon:yes gene_type:complete